MSTLEGTLATAVSPLLAYGAAPGMELIPYFFALVAWLGMALAAVLFWPITATVRRLRRGRTSSPAAEAKKASAPAAAVTAADAQAFESKEG